MGFKILDTSSTREFIARNVPRLYMFVKAQYVLSRPPAYWLTAWLLFYVILDTFIFHEGISEQFLWVIAILLLGTNVGKFILRLLQLHTGAGQVLPLTPRQDDDPFWMRIMLSLGLRRRGAMKFLVISTEWTISLMCVAYIIGRMEAFWNFESLVPLPGVVISLLQSFSAMTFTPNFVYLLAVVEVSGFLTMLTNAVFYLRIRAVRDAAWSVVEQLIRNAPVPAKVFAETLLPHIRGRRGTDANCCPYEELAKTMINVHPIFTAKREMVLPYYDMLVSELRSRMDDNSRSAAELWQHMESRLEELVRTKSLKDPPAK